jgi:hypothetical protein
MEMRITKEQTSAEPTTGYCRHDIVDKVDRDGTFYGECSKCTKIWVYEIAKYATLLDNLHNATADYINNGHPNTKFGRVVVRPIDHCPMVIEEDD